MGRHSTYKQELADEIVERISNGETLRAICREDHMPSWRTIYHWLESNGEFSARIARARELGYDAIAQECIDIANTPIIGEVREESETGVKVRREDALGHRKLQIETRLKLLAKWDPKRYGDRQMVEMNAKLSVSNMTEEEIREELLSHGVTLPDNGQS